MSNRLPKVNELIKRELSGILLKESEFSKDVLVTITRVETSANLQQTKVYISVMPEEKIKEVLQVLNRNIYDFQQKLNKRLSMRPVPKIQFIEEKETKTVGRIEQLLEKIKRSV